MIVWKLAGGFPFATFGWPGAAKAGVTKTITIIAISAATEMTEMMRFILHYLHYRTISSGSLLLVRSYSYTEGLYMGNKYYA